MYTAGGVEYASLFFGNNRYNVRYADVSGCIMSEADLRAYIVNTLWNVTTYTPMNKELDLHGDVNVHSLQYALTLLGYYTGSLDGGFGNGTEKAVAKFQRAYKLTVDGRAGPITQALLYPLARTAYAGGSTAGSTTGTTGATGTTTSGTLKTTAKVNLRKTDSIKSARLAIIPAKVTLAYTASSVSGGVTWYQVRYNNLTGWIMGTYTSIGSSGGTTPTPSTATQIGTVTITAKNTRVRKTANGTKTGYVLQIGNTVPLMAQPTSAAGYTWYYIKYGSSRFGYVRGDCATASIGGGGGGIVTPSTNKVYVQLPTAVTLFTTKEQSATGAVTVPAGTVLQMVSDLTYVGSDNVTYCSVYYNNASYNCVYSAVNGGVMSATTLTSYIVGTLWPQAFSVPLKEALNLTGDVRVHALQYALSVLGFYTGAQDGNFGSGTTTAVKNFQRKNGLTVDGSVGPKTHAKLYPQAIAAYNGTGGGTGGGSTTSAFGSVTAYKKGTWAEIDGGSKSLFGRSTYAYVMDIATKQIFRIYRIYGSNHADCVPATSADTQIVASLAGVKYSSSSPSTSQINQIIGDGASDNATYTWPDFGGGFGISKKATWPEYSRACIINLNGVVYPVSIYLWPHGYDTAFGKYSYADTKKNCVKTSNYYGMMCVHFYGSLTHGSGTLTGQNLSNVENAWSWLQSNWSWLQKQ